jgi:hypothetical protein
MQNIRTVFSRAAENSEKYGAPDCLKPRKTGSAAQIHWKIPRLFLVSSHFYYIPPTMIFKTLTE